MGSVIWLALDAFRLQQRATLEVLRELAPETAGVKIHVHWHRHGPRVVDRLRTLGFQRVWVDLKLHDTPSTVGRIAETVAGSGATHLTVHAAGGIAMMKAAKQSELSIIGVTVLTSQPLRPRWTSRQACALAKNAKEAGIDGIVCAIPELKMLGNLRTDPLTLDDRELSGLRFYVPGIRNPSDASHDQMRTGMAETAMKLGADYLVIGRPITESKNPQETLFQLNQSVIGVIEGS